LRAGPDCSHSRKEAVSERGVHAGRDIVLRSERSAPPGEWANGLLAYESPL